MASKRVGCSWCKTVSIVPLEAQSLYCSACRRYSPLERSNNGYNRPYGGNANGNGNGNGNGYGNGYGNSNSNGYGNANGNGIGIGYGNGNGYANGYGYGYGNGNGYANGNGNGYGNGNGNDYGSGNDNGYDNGNITYEGNGNGNGNFTYGRVSQPMSSNIGAAYQVQPRPQQMISPPSQVQPRPPQRISPPSQVQPRPQQRISPPSHGHGRKRAVLCGINYEGHRQSLQGSVNDVMLMKKLLLQTFHFPVSSILILTEEEQDYRRIPTKRNIRGALRWLVEGTKPGDSLVFFYSGHGSQVRDGDGDEVDGYDEALMPVDYETEGRILDDEMNATIIRPLPRGAMLHAIIDTCFSGTFLDLPNVCRINRQGHFKWEDHRSNATFRGTTGGFAVSISACDDHQNSGDTTAFTGDPAGALTYSFVQIMEQNKRLSYGNLLIGLHQRIGAARDAVGLISNDSKSSQEPQLSSSHNFDIHAKNFTL